MAKSRQTIKLKLKSNTKYSLLIIIGAIASYFLIVNADKIIPKI